MSRGPCFVCSASAVSCLAALDATDRGCCKDCAHPGLDDDDTGEGRCWDCGCFDCICDAINEQSARIARCRACANQHIGPRHQP